MLGSRKYRRWLNNQLLINKGRTFQIHQYCDNYEFDEIESIIISSSFRDPNYVVSPSIWIKLSSDDELHELFLDCKEREERGLEELAVSPAEQGATQARSLLASLKKICSGLEIDQECLFKGECSVESVQLGAFTNINLKSCITGYLGKIFGEVLTLLDRDSLVEYVLNIENLMIEFIQDILENQQKQCGKTDRLVLVSDKDCRTMSICDIKDYKNGEIGGLCFASSEFKSYLSSDKRPNLLIVKGCNKLLRKIVHCLCGLYCLNSRSISVFGESKYGRGNDEKTMVLTPCKSANAVILPQVKVSTLLKINQIYSKKQNSLTSMAYSNSVSEARRCY